MAITSSRLQLLIVSALGAFYRQRLAKINSLKLRQVLKRKNPYLFRAVGTQSAVEIVEKLLSAYISSSDETLFGDAFFEPVAKAVSGGVVAPSEGVDIAIEKKDRYLAIAVKSGPNPFNSSAKKRQDDEFRELRSRLLKLRKQFDALLGYCYGQKQRPAAGKYIYRESAGQAFWEEITGDSDFYMKLIRLMKQNVIDKHKDEYKNALDRAMNRYLQEFTSDFCRPDGAIDWEKLLEFNSGKKISKS
jgi:hypothetical protein